MTAKSDLWEAYPFGMVGAPMADVVAVHGSSGTGGRPTLVAYTRADLALWARMCARALADVVPNCSEAHQDEFKAEFLRVLSNCIAIRQEQDEAAEDKGDDVHPQVH